jgi:hypothetical protein
MYIYNSTPFVGLWRIFSLESEKLLRGLKSCYRGLKKLLPRFEKLIELLNFQTVKDFQNSVAARTLNGIFSEPSSELVLRTS